MRNLVSLRRVSDIRPIPDADAIETAVVDGWEVVVKKGEFNIGDPCLFFEIDSFVPNEIAPFLTRPGKEPREYNGIKGERLRTVRLRKQLSQGLLLPASILWERDLSAALGVVKWEPPVAACLRGVARGNFPSYIRKTDQERIQNCQKVIQDKDTLYEVSLKLDGSSCTTYCYQGELGVCSRNINLKMTEENAENQFIAASTAHGFLELVRDYFDDHGRSIAIQAELMGPGIQKNREKFTDFRLFIFDIWDIDEQRYLTPGERIELLEKYGMSSYHIPTYPGYQSFATLGVSDLKELLAFVDTNHPFSIDGFGVTSPIEGLVFKSVEGRTSFKAISNKFLEREDDSV